MPNYIADALVLVFTYGVSLREWEVSGMLGREWALYHNLLPHYRKLVIVTYGRQDDAATLADIMRSSPDADRVSLVCNTHNLTPAQYVASLPLRVQTELMGFDTAVVKTNQMAGGDIAVRITESLRSQGIVAALIARGGYLWTRFVAHDHGPHSQAAVEAAARERTLCLAADAVVGTTDEMVADLAWRYGLDPVCTAVIPNYALTDREPVCAHDREKGYLLYAGQLIPRKRVSILIEAINLLADNVREGLNFEIIGDGVERANLEALAKKLNVPVTFANRVPHDQLLVKMRSCTLYLQASELEGHPKTVLEAMAAGAVPVVADAPGMEVVQHGVCGLRLGPEPRLFAHAITELLADADWRSSLGATAASTTRAAYSLSRILQQEVAVHQRALDRARRAASKAAA
jgi:glycosyltransferase involved in cell wall biosynthesis